VVKALCAVLHRNPSWLDQGDALLEVCDSIDLMAIQKASAADSAAKKIGRVQATSDRIQAELNSVSLSGLNRGTSLAQSGGERSARVV
jgi:hypothetical protein